MDRLFPRSVLACFLWFLCAYPPAVTAQNVQESPPGATQTAPVSASSVTSGESMEAERLSKMPPSEGLGDTLNVRGRYLAAIHVYESLPPTAAVLNKLGIACEHMLMYDRALVSFQAALKLNPRYADVYNNLGTLAHSQGNLREAEKMYRKALKLKPDSASPLQNLGTLYYAQRKFKKGDQAFKEALAIDPHLVEHSGHSIQTRDKGTNISEIHYHLAMTYAQAGSHDLALKYLRQAINEGFHDRNRLLHDKEFADIRTMPTFLQMVDDLKN